MGVRMTLTRRKFIHTSTAVAALSLPGPAHSQSFTARQYHSQPKDSHLQLYLTKIWNAVREETSGRLSVTVHARNNGATVGDPEIFTQLQTGELEFFALNGSILSQAAPAPAADIQGIPFAFSSSQQVAALNDGEFGNYLRGELVSKGIQLIPFGSMENGFKQITSVDRPIQKANDLRGFKMRVPNGKLFVDFYNALGATPKIVDFDRLYQALASHEVDGQENPLVDAEDNKLYEVCRYVGLTSHQWAGYNMLANQAFWQRLPEDVQDSIVRNTKKFVPRQRAFVQTLNASAENKLRDRGMIFTRADTESFRKILTDVGFYKKWRASCGERAWALMEAQTGPVG
jgi:tripartite ATP-independent transporter DctP family solute receptor